MKKEIICLICGLRVRKKYPTDNPFPGEYIKLIRGVARKETFTCDHCNAEIAEGEDCFAFSTWNASAPYRPWEELFIKIPPVSK